MSYYEELRMITDEGFNRWPVDGDFTKAVATTALSAELDTTAFQPVQTPVLSSTEL